MDNKKIVSRKIIHNTNETTKNRTDVVKRNCAKVKKLTTPDSCLMKETEKNFLQIHHGNLNKSRAIINNTSNSYKTSCTITNIERRLRSDVTSDGEVSLITPQTTTYYNS